MLDEYLGQQVVVDLKSLFVCLGTLQRFDDVFLELRNADFHDLRDSDATREVYVVSAHHSGIKRNRKRILLMRSEVAAISRFQDVVED
jgi:small nuclear ribonucleoprotein (snRNP)-like protein